MVCIDMNNYDRILNVAEFVRPYQKNLELLIGSLEEIVSNEGMLTYEQLQKAADEMSYKESLMRLCNPQVG